MMEYSSMKIYLYGIIDCNRMNNCYALIAEETIRVNTVYSAVILHHCSSTHNRHQNTL